VTEWTGYQDNHSGYLGFCHSQHYCRAASAGSTVLTNDLRYRHSHHDKRRYRPSSQIMAETQLNINKLVPFAQTNLRLDDDILDAVLTLLARAALTFLL
jgi:hypothetical protein